MPRGEGRKPAISFRNDTCSDLVLVIFNMTTVAEFMLNTVNIVEKIALVVAANVTCLNKFFAEATIEANDLSITVSTANAPIFHSRRYSYARIPWPSRLTRPAFLFGLFGHIIALMIFTRHIGGLGVMLAVVITKDRLCTRHLRRLARRAAVILFLRSPAGSTLG